MKRLLVACEESQRVCTAFREVGWEAYSCDIIECSGGHPEWHIQQDVLPLLIYQKPNQIIQPYQFGHHAKKTTCLWTKNLRNLIPTNIVDAGKMYFAPNGKAYSVGANAEYAKDENGKIIAWNDPRTAKIRSKTFPGIAKAMAEQWGKEESYD